MYIGSPVDKDGHSDDNDDDEENDNLDYGGTHHHADPEDHESDDSMASDASSGPSHYGVNPLGNFYQEGGEGYDEYNKYCLHRKAISKTKENKTKIVEKRVEKKKEMVFINTTKGKAPVQGSGIAKVRKHHWLGKEK